MASSRLSFDHVPAIMRSMWFTVLGGAPDKTLVKPVPDFYVRTTKTCETNIILSTVRYGYNIKCCERVRPVSEVARPNIPTALSSSPICSKKYGTVRVPTLFSDMVPMNPAAGQLSPTSSAIALVAVGLYSRPAQGLTSMKCACHAADASADQARTSACASRLHSPHRAI
jgi:hypothetical protein